MRIKYLSINNRDIDWLVTVLKSFEDTELNNADESVIEKYKKEISNLKEKLIDLRKLK